LLANVYDLASTGNWNKLTYIFGFRPGQILEADEACDAESFFDVAAKSMEQMKESLRTMDGSDSNHEASGYSQPNKLVLVRLG
jgi:hypothetical protein